MRRDSKDTRGRIPPEQHRIITGGMSAGKTLEQNWQLTEAKVYDALDRLNSKYLYWQSEHGYDHNKFQEAFGEITTIEQAAINLYGHWIVYGWEKTKQMVREIYPGLVNESITSMISGIGKEM